ERRKCGRRSRTDPELWWAARFTIHLEYGHLGASTAPGDVPTPRDRLVRRPRLRRSVRARPVTLHQEFHQWPLRYRTARARRDRGRVDHAAVLREGDGIEGDRDRDPAHHDAEARGCREPLGV